ncbi:MAG: hypothetical protein AB7S48_07535 [Bacteroidales bacterium]
MQNSSLTKVLKVLSWLLMGISIVLTVIFYSSDLSDKALLPAKVEPFIIWAYILFGLAVVLALIFPIYYFIRNPKNALNTLLGIGLMAVVFGIGYALGDATPITTPTNDPNFSNINVLTLTDAGLIGTYIMFGAALLLMFYTGVRSVFNK